MKKLFITSILWCLVNLLACKQTDVTPKANIDPALLPYFNKFLEEGKKRGVTFTAEEQAITMQFSNLPIQDGYLGLTTYKTRTIDIVPEWKGFSEPRKERLICHELGHLMLGRSHDLSQLPDGECKSFMWTSENNPIKCIAPTFKGNLRKNYYYDELFNPNTSTPKWASEPMDWKEVAQTKENTVVGPNSWNTNPAWETFVQSSAGKLTYNIVQNTMSIVVSKQTNLTATIPLYTLFPTLREIPLQNYEVRLRYKLYGNGFDLGWKPNNGSDQAYFLRPNPCEQKAYLGVDDNEGGFFFNNKLPQNLNGINELVLQHKDNYIKIWQNGILLFQTDIPAATVPSTLQNNLNLTSGQYDFEFITVTRL